MPIPVLNTKHACRQKMTSLLRVYFSAICARDHGDIPKPVQQAFGRALSTRQWSALSPRRGLTPWPTTRVSMPEGEYVTGYQTTCVYISPPLEGPHAFAYNHQ
jgi:hypothetical protein